jgi:solute carrier family 25 citrate transporter 1
MNYYSINYYDNRKILFGPIAGIIESIAMQPLDTMKVLKQSNQYTSFSEHIRNPRFLYKGLTPFTSQMMVKYFLRFTTFELFKSKNDNFARNFGAGICAGFTESLFITPFELIKTNLQTTENKKPLKVINKLYTDNGIKGLYRGFSTTAIRQCTNQAFNFSVYYKLRKLFIKENEKPNIFKIVASSLFSSSIGPVLTSPIDTIKTRFMNPKYTYKSVFDAFKDIYRNDGVKGFYKGLSFRLLRVCGGQAITFCVVENLLYYTN